MASSRVSRAVVARYYREGYRFMIDFWADGWDMKPMYAATRQAAREYLAQYPHLSAKLRAIHADGTVAPLPRRKGSGLRCGCGR